jgi:hypothetical protein
MGEGSRGRDSTNRVDVSTFDVGLGIVVAHSDLCPSCQMVREGEREGGRTGMTWLKVFWILGRNCCTSPIVPLFNSCVKTNLHISYSFWRDRERDEAIGPYCA